MIDWTSLFIELNHSPLQAGAVVCIEADGTIAWETPRKMQVRGSHESSMHVRSVGGDGKGNATHLYIDGNPSKWLQGHNLLVRMTCSLSFGMFSPGSAGYFNLSLLTLNVRKLGQGSTGVTRIDYNRMFELQVGRMFAPGCELVSSSASLGMDGPFMIAEL
ncbi:hypothetical protein THL1_3069 [Pseudomonas sp. TCU-HL1]|nr:phage/plasmid replication protein, II/X family [Pseudomonas sp. TCU-HL1]AOE85617.1 hypothetical protein THL1_3069 [Pseudomonas sp. TCU-HL1]